jgi:sugar phosphate isomerase/epimerase
MFKHSYTYFTWGLEKQYDIYGKPEQIFDILKKLGYDGVEVPGEPSKIDAKKLKETLNSYDLEVPAVTGLFGNGWGFWSGHGDPTHPEDKQRQKSVEYIKKCIEMMVVLDAKYFNVCPCPTQQLDVSVEKLNEAFAKTVKESAKYAEEYGVNVPIEPVNRFEGYFGVVNTLSQAKDLMEQVGPENTGIFADIFHMNIEESSILRAIMENGKYIVHIHCVDSNRKGPGMGCLDFKPIFETLKFVGFNKYLSVEAIPPKPDPRIIAEKAIKYMQTIELMIGE